MGETFNEIVALAKKIFKEVRFLNLNRAEKNLRKILLFVKKLDDSLNLKGIIYKRLWFI